MRLPCVCGCLEYPSRSRSSEARTSNLRRCSRSASRTSAERFSLVLTRGLIGGVQKLSYREQSGLFPYVDSVPQYTPQHLPSGSRNRLSGIAGGEAPAVSMQPAGLVLVMRVAAQGSDARAPIAAQHFGKRDGDFGIARATEGDEVCSEVQAGIETIGASAGQEGHRSWASLFGANGNRSFPPGLRAASQDGCGCVAPALATITSAGSNGPIDPLP